MARDATYVVTGGAGFIGSHIATALVDRGQRVRIFDNLSTGKMANIAHLTGRLEVVQGDLRDLASTQAAIAGAEVVFHQAALPSVPRSVLDPIGSLESNINGTLHVLLAARDAGVRRVVYASSSSVYGNSAILPKQEDMPTAPQSPYAVQKLAGEHLCQVFSRVYGQETVVLRYFNVFGPRQDPDSEYAAVIPRFITALLARRRPIVYGDGWQTRDFTYVENVIHANLLAAEVPITASEPINIGSGTSISLNLLLRLAQDMVGSTVEPEYHAARLGDIHDSLADIYRAKTILGYTPQVDFRDGLRRTVESIQGSLRQLSYE